MTTLEDKIEEQRPLLFKNLDKIQHQATIDAINTEINEYCQQLASSISITQYAMDKAHDIALQATQLSKQAGKTQDYEVGFMLTSTKEDMQNHTIAIHDCIIPKEQYDTPILCEISPDDMSQIQHQFPHTVSGWGHSHAMMSTFFSDIDRNTRNTLTQSTHAATYTLDLQTVPYQVKIGALACLVVNAIQSQPSVSVSIDKMSIGRDEQGHVIAENAIEHYEHIPIHCQDLQKEFPKLNITNNNGVCYNEHEDTRNKLIDSITYDDGTRLQDLVQKRTNDIIAPLVEITIGQTDQKTSTPTTLIDEEQSIDAIAQTYTHNEYTHEVEPSFFFIPPSRPSKLYTTLSKQDYLQDAHPTKEHYLDELSLLLSGEYRADKDTLLQGSLEYDADSTRLWTWEQRIDAIPLLLKKYEKIIGDMRQEHSYIMDTIRKQKYVTIKYPHKIATLDALLCPHNQNIPMTMHPTNINTNAYLAACA